MEATTFNTAAGDCGTNASKVVSIKNAISKALDGGDTEFALELINCWESDFPLEKEGKSMLLFTKLQVLIQCFEQARMEDERVACLRRAVATCNELSEANELEGFPMDPDVQYMCYRVIDLSAQFMADADERGTLTEAMQDDIGRVNLPNCKPKPPRKYDDSLTGKLLRAIDRNMAEFGDLDSNAYNLVIKICQEFGINAEEFIDSIYNY